MSELVWAKCKGSWWDRRDGRQSRRCRAFSAASRVNLEFNKIIGQLTWPGWATRYPSRRGRTCGTGRRPAPRYLDLKEGSPKEIRAASRSPIRNITPPIYPETACSRTSGNCSTPTVARGDFDHQVEVGVASARNRRERRDADPRLLACRDAALSASFCKQANTQRTGPTASDSGDRLRIVDRLADH